MGYKKLKIGIVVPNRYPVPAVKGGAVEGLVEQLLRQNEIHKKLEIVVFSPYDQMAEAEAGKYKESKVVYIYRKPIDRIFENKVVTILNLYYAKYRSKSIFTYPYVRRIIKEIIKEETKQKFDIIVCESGEYIQYKALSDHIGREKMVIHFHGEMAGNTALKNWFSHYICVSSYIGRKLIENGYVSSNQVDILLNGIPTENFSQLTSDIRSVIRKQLSFDENHVVLIYWGRIIPEKGVKELIQAFKIALEHDDRLRLMLFGGAHFGNKEKLTQYERDISSICVDCNEIQLNGFISNKELQKYISASDIAVLPSIWDEPAALAMIEASCIGIPMITTGTGGMREYIRDTDHHFVTWSANFVEDLAKSILDFAKNPEQWEKARVGAEYYRNRFNSGRYYCDYVSLVDKYCRRNAYGV